MSETGTEISNSGDTGQPPPTSVSLFDLVVGMLFIATIWLLAAALTEVIHIRRTPLDGAAYGIIYCVMVLLLLCVTGLISLIIQALRKRKGKAETTIKTPALLQQGFVRIVRWFKGSPRRWIPLSAGIGVMSSVANRIATDAVGIFYTGPRIDLYHIVAMVIGVFGTFIFLVLGASLIAGLMTNQAPRE